MSCALGEDHVPSLRNHNIVKGIVPVAEAGQSNPKDHLVGCAGDWFCDGIRHYETRRADQTPQKFKEVSESKIFRDTRKRNSVGVGGG